MPTILNVVALISGGKDSVFSIYHCRAKGHKIVALANLFPPGDDRDSEDMNSFMYQTIGHSVIPLYEKAFQIPLFRMRIQGLATNIDKYYSPPANSRSVDGPFPQDETESLYHLLSVVKTAHPEADAVCTGAILSDYQRSRVESVALRLGLQSLAYLWQYPYLPPHTQTSLLEDMESIRHRAIIIKVASGGLDESFLGQNVADSRIIVKLRRAMGKFGPIQGGSVLGEGGEYETLSVNGPGDLWSESVAIDTEQMQIILGEGGTAALNIRNAKLSRKEDLDMTQSESLRTPEGLDPEFECLRRELETTQVKQKAYRNRGDYAPFTVGASNRFSMHVARSLLYINNLGASTNTQGSGSVDEQMSVIISRLASLLKGNNLQDSDVIFSTLILRSMSDFRAVNTVYGAFFSRPQPPARVTVACGSNLPGGVDVTLSVVVNRLNASLRRGLHVQSISYWAPANIGPYSQAVGIASGSGGEDGKRAQVVYMAGQIPLVPATMELVNYGETIAEFKEQTVLSLQHLWRVGRAMAVENWLVGIAFVATPSQYLQTPVEELADVALDAWSSLYDLVRSLDHQDEDSEAEGVDVWDRKYGLNRQDDADSSSTIDTRH
ncbi:adenine nucleotide alpha hydrolases-like protein, partial [Viridothelium virens]